MVEPVRIHLLGGFLLEQGHRALPPIPSRTGRSLFAYLAVHADRNHTRSRLAGLFWPDLPDGKARRRLSQALWQIQDALSEADGDSPYLLSHGDTLAINRAAPYWLDVEEFEVTLDAVGPVDIAPETRVLAIGVLQSAVELYAGDFLAGFYEDWITFEQERLRERYLDALTLLIELLTATGDHQTALVYARRLANHDPLREDAHRAVMRLCFLLGRTSDALQQYERCRAVLEDELALEPSAETQELHARIVRTIEAVPERTRDTTALPLLRTGETVPFVGRRAERARLIDHVELAMRGQGGVVIVEGEPGVGKTRLVREAAADAAWRGFEVLWGSCHEARVARPYGSLLDALAPWLTPLRAEQLSQRLEPIWLQSIARLDPRLEEWLGDHGVRRPLKAAEESQRMREAVVRMVLAVSRSAPTMFVVDDVQWADHETLGLLSDISEHLAANRILIVTTSRRDESRARAEVWDTLRLVDGASGLGRIIVEPFTLFDLNELVHRSVGVANVARGFALRLFEDTGGNPLFALETLRALHDQGRLDPSRAGDDAPVLPITANVERVIASRVELVPTEQLAVLRTVAANGAEIDQETLARAVDAPRPVTIDALAQLLTRGFLREVDTNFDFHHEQIRRVVERETPAAVRRDVHSRLATAIERTHPADAERLAYHFTEACIPDRAVRYLTLAGERALTLHAYASAVEHLDRAAELALAADLPREAHCALLANLELCLDVLGRRDEQSAVLDRLAEVASEPAARAEIERRRAWLYAHTDRFAEAEDAARNAAALADAAGDERVHVLALSVLATALRWSGRAAAAVPHLEAAVEMTHDDSQAEADVRCALGQTLAEAQRYSAAQRELRRARKLAAAIGDRRTEAEALGELGVVALEQGHPRRAEAALNDALAQCRSMGHRHGEGRHLVNLANLFFIEGRVAEALAHYDDAARVFRDLRNARGEAIVRTNAASVRHIVLGDDDHAERDARQALDWFRSVGERRGEAQCMDVLGGIALRRGDMKTASDCFTSGLRALADEPDVWLEVQLQRSLAGVELDAGRAGDAVARLDHALHLSRDRGVAFGAQLEVSRARALLELGRAADAWMATTAAVQALEQDPTESRIVWWAHHRAAAATGRIEIAATALERAHDELDRTLQGLSDADRRRAIERVPEHAAIAADWSQAQPVRRTFRLPTLAAPTGRPLRHDDFVEVVWTVEHLEDQRVVDAATRRRQRTMRLLDEAHAQGAAPTIEDLAAALEVSRSTVRRDLAVIRRAGKPVRTRGSRPA
jgi:DNA-binding SARP family transcriptional activator/Tfp pilus assembly protein PilF/DNA-binding transcriptional ArsR family regulator